MAKTGKSLTELAAEIERRSAAKRDLIAPVAKMTMEVQGNAPALVIDRTTAESVTQIIDAFPVNNYAHGQIADYAGIPLAYYRRMQGEAPELLASNVNRWLRDLAAKEQSRMIRTLDGKVRALLSPSYRTLEYEDLAATLFPVFAELDLMLISAEITDRRFYLKAIDRAVQEKLPTGRAFGDGSHTWVEDLCSPGITVSDSEVGGGALSIETGVYTHGCTNLAMFGHSMRKFHTGKRADVSDDVYQLLTDETKRLTDATVWAQTRDIVKGAFARAQFDALMSKLGAAVQDKVEPQAVTEVIERIGRKFSFSDVERKGVLARLIEGADLTRYGVHSAITRHSADVEDYDRATELERIGGDVIELPRNDWQQLVAA